jgi:DNA-binding NarL/FixJ family response regulator
MSNKQIATHLDVAVYTVKCHVHHLLEKLALHTRLEVAASFTPEPRNASDDSTQRGGMRLG